MLNKKDVIKYPNIHIKRRKGETQLALVAKIGGAMRKAGASEEEIYQFYDHVIKESEHNAVYETIELYVNLHS